MKVQQIEGLGKKRAKTKKAGREEGNVLFNDALNTFYLWLKDDSDSERKSTSATWATLSD